MDDLYPDYYKFVFVGIPDDIVLSELYQLGFESFEEKGNSLEGYVPANLVNESWKNLLGNTYTFSENHLVKQQNWNKIWESSFQPIIVEDQVAVRATFHEPIHSPYEIIIDPKMAFGTGHHATTYLVMGAMLKLDFINKQVLDFGCGSSILAILAEKLGADQVAAIDYDPWSVNNSLENIELNHCKKILVEQGDTLKSETRTFDIILANITRDTLLNTTEDIVRILNPGGVGIYSGFILRDISILKKYLHTFGINKIETLIREDWCALIWNK